MNQAELASHCSLIGTKDADFNSQCIYNAKRLFYETVSPKNHDRLCLVWKDYQDALLVWSNETPPAIDTDTHAGEKSTSSTFSHGFVKKLRLSFVV